MQPEFKMINKEINLNHLKNKKVIFTEIKSQVKDFLNLYLESRITLKIRIELRYVKYEVIHTKKKEYQFDLHNHPENIFKFYQDINFPLDSVFHRIIIENWYCSPIILMINRDFERMQRQEKFLNRKKYIYIRNEVLW